MYNKIPTSLRKVLAVILAILALPVIVVLVGVACFIITQPIFWAVVFGIATLFVLYQIYKVIYDNIQ